MDHEYELNTFSDYDAQYKDLIESVLFLRAALDVSDKKCKEHEETIQRLKGQLKQMFSDLASANTELTKLKERLNNSMNLNAQTAHLLRGKLLTLSDYAAHLASLIKEFPDRSEYFDTYIGINDEITETIKELNLYLNMEDR